MLAAHDRLVSYWQAERAADIADVAGRGDTEGDFAVLEVGAALHLTGAAARHEVAFAVEVTERLPHVHDMLTGGRIDVRRARVLVDGTGHLSTLDAFAALRRTGGAEESS